MKDAEARRRLQTLEMKHGLLVSAFDRWFDLVAADLGYQGHKQLSPDTWLHELMSPRQPAVTNPLPEIIRKPTARCKK